MAKKKKVSFLKSKVTFKKLPKLKIGSGKVKKVKLK